MRVLDAWEELETELPKGWRIQSLGDMGLDGPSGVWSVWVGGPSGGTRMWLQEKINPKSEPYRPAQWTSVRTTYAEGDSPVAALQAMTSKLREGKHYEHRQRVGYANALMHGWRPWH